MNVKKAKYKPPSQPQRKMYNKTEQKVTMLHDGTRKIEYINNMRSYKFGNKLYKQETGGSIGDRWTGAAAELVVQDWAEKYQNILLKSGMTTPYY